MDFLKKRVKFLAEQAVHNTHLLLHRPPEKIENEEEDDADCCSEK